MFFACTEVDEQERHPNIVYILADDLGIGDIGAFNMECKIATPHIDNLAKEGMIFTDAHTSSSVCTPTRYGILTGRYNWRSRLKQSVLSGKSKALIPNSRLTVASMLKKHGYHTAFIGKWHLGWDWSGLDSAGRDNLNWDEKDFDDIDFSKPISNGPNDLGFDYAYGHSGSLDMAPYVYVENGRVTALPDRVTVDKGKFTWWREGPTGSDFIHEEVTPNFFNKAIDYVQRQSDTGQPFFLYLALPSPHTPILPTEEWLGKSALNPYADFVMMVDHYVGLLQESLVEQGIADNTMVVFTSDNGCSPQADFDDLQSKGHYPSAIYRGHKADIYEGGHRVPFIVNWPEVIQGGTANDDLICTTDLMGTLADLLGYQLRDNEGEDSFSFLSYLKQEDVPGTLRPDVVHHSINGSFAIRNGVWKLIMAPGSAGWSYPRPGRDKEVLDTLPPIQLYNLADDPGETINLQDANPEVVKELKSLLSRYILDGRSTAGDRQPNDPVDSEWWQIEFVGQ